MPTFAETLGAFLSKLAELLGIKSSEKKKLDAMAAKLAAARAENSERLDLLKGEIRRLEARALQKKREMDEARGDSKRIVAGEIERTIRELDRLRGRENVIGSNLERISVAQAKLGELIAAKAQGVEESQLDDLALDLQSVFADLKQADRAVKDLEREQYEPPRREAVDTGRRVEEVEGARTTETPLSPSAMERLKQLEAAEE